MKQNILLIGHKSFVGNQIKKLILKESKLKIFVLDKYFLENDILSLNSKEFNKKYFLKYKKIDAVVSCLHIHKKEFKDELILNIKAYKHILYFLKIKQIKKIIYLSSINVSKKKSSPYAYVKYRVENLFNNYNNFIIVRPSTIISLDKKKKLLGGTNGASLNLFEKLFNYNLPIPIIGDGKYLFTICFLNDLANFIILLLKDNILLNKKINFFTGEFLNFNTFIDYIGLIKKKNVHKFYLPLPLINFFCKLKILDYKKIDNLLNQRIYYNYYDLIKKRIKINQLVKITKKK